MARTIPFTLVTPTAVAFQGEAELIIARGTQGEFGIQAGHAPFVTLLRPGILRANVVEGGQRRRLELALSAGVLQADPKQVTILVDQALTKDEIDLDQARADLEQALEQQKGLKQDAHSLKREQERIDTAQAKITLAA